ncbi:MAG: alpha/beta hydrolase [Oligoflexia bacterium]|nr:alpha/beta hydrolase [Oligoflexia bacterium]
MSTETNQNIYFRVLGPQDPNLEILKDKSPIVFLHGLMGFSANWGKIWPSFQDNRNVLVLDQRGHGKSPKPLTGYSPKNYADDLYSLLTKLGWAKIHLVGHSMGGRVAVEFAHLYPNLLHSLIIEDSGMDANPSRLNWIKNLLGKIPTPFPNREVAKKFFQDHFIDDPMTGTFLHANLEQKTDETYDWKFYPKGMIETIELGRAQNAIDMFSSLNLPILIIRGSLSKEFPQEEAEKMVTSNANAHLITIKDAGHFVHAQQPQAFVNALDTFISKVEESI